ncbi:MAG: hypothetical protein AAGI36_00795 [Pseudomonadota bacterium]
MPIDAFYLTPLSATLLFVVAIVSGYRYRWAWKRDAPNWQLWLYGSLAGSCLLIVGLVPMNPG